MSSSVSSPVHSLSIPLPAGFDWPGEKTFTRHLERHAPGITITECHIDGDAVEVTCTSGKLRAAVERCLKQAFRTISTGSAPSSETLTGNLGVVDKADYPGSSVFAVNSVGSMDGGR